MKYQIKKEHHGQFNPTWVNVIDGKVTKVTLKEANDEPLKYALMGMAHLYNDSEKLIEEAKKRQKKVIPVAVDMNTVRRGTAFNPESNVKKSAVSAFKEKQELNLLRISKRKNLAMQEPVKIIKEAVLSAKEQAKKDEAKAKKSKELEGKTNQ